MAAELNETTSGAQCAPPEGNAMSMSIEKKIVSYAVASVSATQSRQQNAAKQHFRDEADRRLVIGKVPDLKGVLRWEKRPQAASGHPAHIYMVDSPTGSFAVVISHIHSGHDASPFEVWIVGDGAPRGMSALAKSISMDMRTLDRAWLLKKLQALQKVDDQHFNITMPDGIEIEVKSSVEAVSKLIEFRCRELGVFDDANGETPLIDALMSKREPKTTADGTMAWSVDVHNPHTNDDCVLYLKEAELDDGQRRPFSVWLSGAYPKSLDSICKSLSLDMRVVDPAWVLRKVDQLIDLVEQKAAFRAQIPGGSGGKTAEYPSTVAYIASLIRHRFRMLGHCNGNGQPAGKTALSVIENNVLKKASEKSLGGANCTECGAVGAVTKSAGCDTCTACGASRCS